MGNIRNLQILKTFTDFFKLKIGDPLGDIVGRMIIPVVSVSIPPANVRTANTTLSDGTSATIFTTSLTADTYLTGALISTAKDVNATSLFSSIRAALFGRVATVVLRTRYEPVTVGSNINASLFFKEPILLERGSAITVTNSTAIASIDTSGQIFFYEIED